MSEVHGFFVSRSFVICKFVAFLASVKISVN